MCTIRAFMFFLFFSLLSAGSVSAQTQTLNIGFLIPDMKTTAARDGALLAVRDANAQGGYDGKRFDLIVRSTAGPWGTGSKMAVSMIFDHDVVAIAASLDGRNAHLAEQITTKTKVAFVSTWSPDMTLSYAFVPWFFRVIPDDKAQAATLYDKIISTKKTGKLLVISEDTYDAKNAMETFYKIVDKKEGTIPRHILLKKTRQGDSRPFMDFTLPEADVYLLFGTPALASTFLEQYHQKNFTAPVFGTISLTDDRQPHSQSWEKLGNIMTVSAGYWFTEKGIAFQKRFKELYGYEPGPAAAYAYDGVRMIIRAVRKTGTNRNRIIGYLSGIRYQGVTGEIRYDEKGNRMGLPGLMIIKNGKPAAL